MENLNNDISKLFKEIDELEDEIIKIDSQLRYAADQKRNEGISADPQWFSKANYALKIKQKQVKSKNRQVIELKRLKSEENKKIKEQRKQRDREISLEKEKIKQDRFREFDRCFVDLAKEKLKEETFDKLVKMTKRRMELNKGE